ncbi:MAG: type I 3-dehydroquinate dehydratase [Phycisphaerae bacterium]|nr:type I 3-dehydroquinate dehydratase [Phycisphaerae bacterium]
MTYLAIPIQTSDIETSAISMQQAIDAGAELLELRLDYLDNTAPENVSAIVQSAKKFNVPLIATCRPEWEGGQSTATDLQRIEILKTAVAAGADYVDIELITQEKENIDFSPAKTIVSNHDFEKCPDDLAERVNRIKSTHHDIIKIAYLARHINDSFAALDIMHNNPGAIAMAMGPDGVITRMLAKKLNSLLTFARLDNGTAPGQPTIAEMKNIFRWDKLQPSTKTFGLIGNPVDHSKGPITHNNSFNKLNFDGLYLRFLIQGSQNEFFAFMDNIKQRPYLDIKGFSITLPHKQNALEYVNHVDGQLDPVVKKMGAINTIIFDNTGKPTGYNTDCSGALSAIYETMNIAKSDLANMPVAIIGAGGVSRALVAGLTDAAADITIYNRTLAKAEELAATFNCKSASISEINKLKARLVINCTSIGMEPDYLSSPVPADVLRPDMIVFDTVYTPEMTQLLKDAQAAGAAIVKGTKMFQHQAADQRNLFTKQ